MNRNSGKRHGLGEQRIGIATAVVLGYIATVLAGAAFLLAPPCNTGNLSILNALFTATSAVCVTGLVVVDTATAFTPLGQLVLMVLIQIGGLGYMTITAVIVAVAGSKGSLHVRKMAATSMGASSHGEVLRFGRGIVAAALIVEAVAVIPLWWGFRGTHGTESGLWHAAFHSISAFNNAGFSTLSRNLLDYRTSIIINATIMALIVAGGLGFRVWRDLKRWAADAIVTAVRARGGSPSGGVRRHRGFGLSLHSKIVLWSTAFLLVVPILVFYLMEASFAQFAAGERFLASAMASVTARTAGFNTVDYAQMSLLGILVTISLMYIGGSPGGTAGGIKTVSAFLAGAWMWSTLRGRERTTVFKRSVATPDIVRAFQAVALAILTAWFAIMLLVATERDLVAAAGLPRLMLEVVSAFGTVGLSAGSIATPNVSFSADFSAFGQLVIMLAMLVGRAGYLIFAASLIAPGRKPYHYPTEEVLL